MMESFIVESIKKKIAVSRNWVAVDKFGQGVVLDLDKYDLMRRVAINARDLRILDPLLSYPCGIFARGTAIVANLEHIKVIITKHEVLLRDPLDSEVIPIVEELKRRWKPAFQDGDGEEDEYAEFPFEIQALEVVLQGICTSLDAEARELELAAYPALDELITKTNSRNLDRVRRMKSTMSRLRIRVHKVRDEIEQLINHNDRMATLYLSRKTDVNSIQSLWHLIDSPIISSKASTCSAPTNQETNNVEELEMLLEAYLMQIESTKNKLETLREYINDTEDYINIQIDNHRNQLIQLELFLSSGSVCMSIYSAVAAVFGMNIPYPWRENHAYLFKWVVLLTTFVSASTLMLIIRYARRKGLC